MTKREFIVITRREGHRQLELAFRRESARVRLEWKRNDGKIEEDVYEGMLKMIYSNDEGDLVVAETILQVSEPKNIRPPDELYPQACA